jgi:hypothetical protein
MIQSPQNTIAALIAHYGLELEGIQVDAIVKPWLDRYEPLWIVKAIIESLYRGRYKVNSVDRILQGWERIGDARYSFSIEYERGILEKIPEMVAMGVPGMASAIGRSNRQNLGMSPPIFIGADDDRDSEQLQAIEDFPMVNSSNLDSPPETEAELPPFAPDSIDTSTPIPTLPGGSQLLKTLTSIVETNQQGIGDRG